MRPNKKMCVSGNSLKILGRVGTHMFFNYFFFWKKNITIHFERRNAFQNA